MGEGILPNTGNILVFLDTVPYFYSRNQLTAIVSDNKKMQPSSQLFKHDPVKLVKK